MAAFGATFAAAFFATAATFFTTGALAAAFLATGLAAFFAGAAAFFSAAASFWMAFCRALALRSAPACSVVSFLAVLRLVAISFFSAAITERSAAAPAFDNWACALASCFSAAFTRLPILCDTAVRTSLAAVLRWAPAWASSDFWGVLRVAICFSLVVEPVAANLCRARESTLRRARGRRTGSGDAAA